MEIFDVSHQALLAQLFIGLVNGSFYAILSLGLAIIFGLLNVVNFAHGALYMLGALLPWIALHYLGLNYWMALLVAPIAVGTFGMLFERTMIPHLRKLYPIYGLLLTFGIAQVLQRSVPATPTASPACRYSPPALLQGAIYVGFMLPAQLPRLGGRRVVGSLPVAPGTRSSAPASALTCAPAPRIRA